MPYLKDFREEDYEINLGKPKSHAEQYTLTKTDFKERERVDHLRDKFLSPEELASLFKVAKDSIRDLAILQLAYWYGLRISEVGLIQLDDFSAEEKRIKITRIKGGINNTYPIREDCIKSLKRWMVLRGKAEGPLFPSRMTKLGVVQNGQVVVKRRGISKRQLDLLFKSYAERAGLAENHRNFHTLRHTCAVNMVDADVPMRQIQDWLGHRSIKSTTIYAQVSSAKRDKTAAIFYNSIAHSIPVSSMIPGDAPKEKIDWGKALGTTSKKTKEIKNLEKVREST